jgi:hypothetical protein
LWIYLLLSCEICQVIWIFSCSTVWRVYRFLDTVFMDSDRYQCIFRSTTIAFEITGISAPYSFPTISYLFRFREKDVKTKVIWSNIDRFRSFPSLHSYTSEKKEATRHRTDRYPRNHPFFPCKFQSDLDIVSFLHCPPVLHFCRRRRSRCRREP